MSCSGSLRERGKGQCFSGQSSSPRLRGISPPDVHSLLLEDFDPQAGGRYLKALPLTRRKRRALMTSRNWMVNLFCREGECKHDPYEVIPKAGKTVLNVDLSASRLWDLNREGGIYQLLLWAAANGRISDIVGAPPHGSWPTSVTPSVGLESYRYRTENQPYGVKDLTVLEQQWVNNETALVAKQLLLWLMAQIGGGRGVGFLMEFPANVEYLNREPPPGASVWRTEMWRNFSSISGIQEISFYMGTYGHRARRPTTMATTYPALNQLIPQGNGGTQRIPTSLLSKDELRMWPRPFKEMVAEAVVDYHAGSWNEEEDLVKAGIHLNKLTREQRESWHRHFLNDHQPLSVRLFHMYKCSSNGLPASTPSTPHYVHDGSRPGGTL